MLWPVSSGWRQGYTIPLSCHHVRRPDEGRPEAVDVDEKRVKSVDEAPNDVEDGNDSHHPKNDMNELYTEGGTILELDVVVSESRKDHGCTVGMVAIIEMDVNDNRAEGYAFIIVIVNVSHEHVVELHDEDLWREHVDVCFADI